MIVVTGGAGYVGHHVMRLLRGRAIAVDDLRNGHRKSLEEHELIEADICMARQSFDWKKVDAVIHCAGSIEPRESPQKPWLYWWNNVAAAIAFFKEAAGKPVVFSSSCAVYGEPERQPVSEDSPTVPITPYGATKLAVERMLSDLGVQLTVLRYFNPAGADEDHRSEIHLIPNIIRSILLGISVRVYGDGSNVRDYVHVEDIAEAHVRALECPGIYNLGSGKGWTVLEVIRAAERVTGRKVDVEFLAPRIGDPKVLVADVTRARQVLGWTAKRSLEEMIDSHYRWRREHPLGFND